MEKKNTILLTVIAIATLLVAVVGATFAYFTANITSDANGNNNTVNAKTYALTEVHMTYGDEVTNRDGMYPGTTIAKDVSILASCPTGNTTCEPVNTQLTITTTDADDVFGNDIKWTLYKMSSTDDSVVCTPTNHTEGSQYYATTECTGLENGTVVDTFTGKGEKVIDIKAYGIAKANATATEAHDDKYYLVVDYINHTDTTGEDGATISGQQNAQQGKSFSVKMSFAPKA